jgi:FtsH-binding integral membrane protein
MTDRDRVELKLAAPIGAAFGGVTGYLLGHLVESGGLLKILIWALIGAVVATGMTYWLQASRP